MESIEKGISDDFVTSKLLSIASGISALIDGARFATDTNCPRWEFALSADELAAHGIHANELRWLVRRGWLSHAEDVTVNGDSNRQFRMTNDGCQFSRESCFILTDAGIDVLPCYPLFRSDEKEHPASLLPNWNGGRHELTIDGILVKRYRWPAANQETILCTFQEENWPERIDDPLSPIGHVDPKRRLGDTIKCLNRNHVSRLIRFRGDGTGEGILWDRL